MGDPLEPGTEQEPDNVHNLPDRSSVEDRAAAGDGDPSEPEQTAFPGMPEIELGDLPPTLAKLIPRNAAIEVHYSLMSAAIKGKAGLPDPNKAGQLIVSYVPAGYDAKPIRNKPGEPEVDRWKIVVQLRPTYIVALEAAAPDAATG